MSTDSDPPLQTAFAGLIGKLGGVTALVLLCGAVYCAAYFLGTDQESQSTGQGSPQQALEDAKESRSAETKPSEPAPKNTAKSRFAKHKLSKLALEMLNDLLRNFESTSFGPPLVDLFNMDGLEYRRTSATAEDPNSQNAENPLATNAIDPKTMSSQDRAHIIVLLKAEQRKLISEKDEVFYYCKKLRILDDEARRKRDGHVHIGSWAERRAADELQTFLYRCKNDAWAIQEIRELRLERIKLDIKALMKQDDKLYSSESF